MRFKRLARPLATVAIGLGLVGVQLASTGAAGASTHDHHAAYTCSGGNIPAGHYESVIVTGVCYTPSGNVWIEHSLIVKPGALLDAVTPGDPTSGTPVVPATVNVGGNVWVGKGGVLLLGCSPNIACGNPPGISFDHIGGNLTAVGAQGVVLHSVSVEGNVLVWGGGGGAAADTCAAQTPGNPVNTGLEPWSLDASLYFTPVYTDIEDSTIGGNLKIAGLDSCYLATLRTEVWGNAQFINNAFGDPDATEIGSNFIGGFLGCQHNNPAPQYGDGGSAPSIVEHHAYGQCAFSVTMPNPGPLAGGPGINEHISVPAWSLSTYHATYGSTPAFSLPPVTTSSGDTLNANLYNFTLTSTGLSGTGTYDSTKPPGSTGAAILSTTYPDGWTSFEGYLNCACSFGGQTGSVQIRIYGSTSPSGKTFGTFVVASGGALSPGSLSTLAGYGTFTSKGAAAGTLKVTEHVAIT
jgi:hypothetical protein